jgi:hypothetical protein
LVALPFFLVEGIGAIAEINREGRYVFMLGDVRWLKGEDPPHRSYAIPLAFQLPLVSSSSSLVVNQGILEHS